jgi:hypothetical protein
LLQLSFCASKTGTSLFVFHSGKVQIFVLIYVDDIIVASSSSTAIDALPNDLRHDFALKDLDQLSYFLGIEVQRCPDGLVVTHNKYTLDILAHAGMKNCKPTSTPLPTNEKLSLTDGDPLSANYATTFQSIVGALQYLTLTSTYLTR